MNEAYNIDCMEYLKTVPDKYFDLAVVDPPYGGGSAEREKDGLQGGQGEYKGAVVGRFGGRFEKYHLGVGGGNIGIEDRRNLGEQVPRGCL